jgi:Flp pilus assembly protein TadG
MRPARSEAGAALLEFSLIVPLVILMFLGVVDLGLAIAQAMTVEDAARAGAEYGTLPGKGSDAAGMQIEATNVASGLAGFTAKASTWCSCTPGGAASSCTTWCGTAIPIKYVEVDTSATMQILVGWPGLPTSFALTGLAIQRIQ